MGIEKGRARNGAGSKSVLSLQLRKEKKRLTPPHLVCSAVLLLSLLLQPTIYIYMILYNVVTTRIICTSCANVHTCMYVFSYTCCNAAYLSVLAVEIHRFRVTVLRNNGLQITRSKN